jgi:hypothetical protein
MPVRKELPRSIGAVLAGIVFIAVSSFVTDSALQWVGILPVPNEVKFESRHALLALSYHLLYVLLGTFLVAWLAPSRPPAHALALGALGVAVSTLGLIAIVMNDLAPAWYGLALVMLSLPVTWAGGKLFIMSRKDLT